MSFPSFINDLPIKTIVGGSILLIITLVISYYVWNSYLSNKVNYDSNRENNDNNETPTKTAHLMLFYVDWCPHCKTAKPEWNALKEEYDGTNINGYVVVFEEYNCTEESSQEELIEKYKIEGYPTIKLIKDNQVIEYDAKPTKDTMAQFLTTVL
jgi:thiol-disulfide isomerase/thioredoxin